jgi:hypothetical protein
VKTAIYALTDPDGAIRYVGRTDNPDERIEVHLSEARNDGRSEKNRWVRSLVAAGLKPAMIVLEWVDGDGCDRECHHIAEQRSKGARLTNGTSGGTWGFKISQEVIARRTPKIREAQKWLIDDPLFPQIVRRYQSGERTAALARELEIYPSSLIRAFRTAGVRVRTLSESVRLRYAKMTADERQAISAAAHAATRLDVDPVLVERYKRGERPKSLAKEAGIHYETLLKRIHEAGAVLSASDRGRYTWDRISPDVKSRLKAKGGDGRRGKKDPMERKCRRAITRERMVVAASPVEAEFAELLGNRGISTIPQRACGPYNIDLAIVGTQTAVEVISGWNQALIRRDPWTGPHPNAPRHLRTRFLQDSGWDVIEIWLNNPNRNMNPAADYVARFGRTARRQHIVIRAGGKLLPQYELRF